MDLIYADDQRKDLGVMNSYNLDMAYGKDENDFECKIDKEDHCCEADFFLYVEDEEYGGIVDDIKVDTAKGEITYIGRTWHGILENKVICPESGQDYAVFDGEANEVLQSIISMIDLSGLFVASTENSGIQIQAYQMDRYIAGYTGIKKMLKDADAKLRMKWSKGQIILWAEQRKDYSQDEEFDTSQVDFTIRKKYRPVNHIVCLGQGDLKERAAIHIFCDENGGVQQYAYKEVPLQDSDYILDQSKKLLTGQDEVVEILDYSNAEITYNYIMLSTKPVDWDKNSTEYFFASDTGYKNVEEVDVGHVLQKIQPYDWSVNFSEYFSRSGDTYSSVNGTTVYTLQAKKPSDWSAKYEEYYTKSGTTYKEVEGVESVKYTRQTKRPSDWSKNYGNYYYFYSDGVTSEYKSVEGVTKYKYTVQTRKPTDWTDNCTSYYKKKKSGGYEAVSLTKAKKAPTWKAKTFYTRTSYQVAPAWNKVTRYICTKTTNAPTWKASTYYTKDDNAAPTWAKNTYYLETDEKVAPAFNAGQYYKKVQDVYAVMVTSALERIEEAHAADELAIALEETEQTYDVGDIVGTREETTGITSVQEVVKKIIKINNDDVTVSYEVN